MIKAKDLIWGLYLFINVIKLAIITNYQDNLENA